MSPATLQLSQSIMAPASRATRVIEDLTIAMFIGGALVLVLVVALLLRAAWGQPRAVNPRHWLIGGGLLLPGVVLAALLVQGLRIGAALSHSPDLQGMEVEVIARRWWWEFRYRDAQGNGQVVLANELHLPSDCAVVLNLASGDVIHSFWVPALAGKVDAIPGHRNRLSIHASRPGRYRGQCAEYCGTQHANMALEVVVQPPQQFRDWLLNQSRPAVVPVETAARRGLQVFLDGGCGSCHTIRGTAAAGQLGPDLTHLASRRSLAAATLANDPEGLGQWIRGAQHLKPGNLMPSMPIDGDADLRALAAYLGSLH